MKQEQNIEHSYSDSRPPIFVVIGPGTPSIMVQHLYKIPYDRLFIIGDGNSGTPLNKLAPMIYFNSFNFQLDGLHQEILALNQEKQKRLLETIAQLNNGKVPDNLLTDKAVLGNFIDKNYNIKNKGIDIFWDAVKHHLPESHPLKHHTLRSSYIQYWGHGHLDKNTKEHHIHVTETPIPTADLLWDIPFSSEAWSCFVGKAATEVIIPNKRANIYHSDEFPESTLIAMNGENIDLHIRFCLQMLEKGIQPSMADLFELSLLLSPENIVFAESVNDKRYAFTARSPKKPILDTEVPKYVNNTLLDFRGFRQKNLGHNPEHFIDFGSLGIPSIEQCKRYNELAFFRTINTEYKKESEEYAKKYLELGGDCNAQLINGKTLFELASNKNSTHVMKHLLMAGAAITLEHFLNLPSFINSLDKEEFSKILLNITQANSMDDVVRMAIETKNVLLLVKLIEKEIDNIPLSSCVDMQDSKGITMMHHAVVFNNEKLLDLLLQHKANAGITNNYGMTPLHFAANHTKLWAVEKILAYDKTTINHQASKGFTPLHLAAQRGDVGVIEVLLTYGADIHAKDESGWTAINHAQKYKYNQAVAFLVEKGSSTDLHLPIDTTDDKGITPLHYAAKYGYNHAARTLIKQGADVHAKDESGWTPLYYAIIRKNAPSIALLIKNKANVNINSQGITPLHLAVLTKDPVILQLLLPRVTKETLNQQDYNGKTPLHYAAREGSVDLIKALLIKGADITLKDKNGKTAEDVAKEHNHEGASQLLNPSSHLNKELKKSNPFALIEKK